MIRINAYVPLPVIGLGLLIAAASPFYSGFITVGWAWCFWIGIIAWPSPYIPADPPTPVSAPAFQADRLTWCDFFFLICLVPPPHIAAVSRESCL